MILSEYQKKRNFEKTPEPKGKQTGNENNSTFVIQKHKARNLHYDLRLELKGVLKSWALPKGPSVNPNDKRLAMMVEDHPYDYKDFEGIIPEGNYGAGTVMIWDQGNFLALGATSKKETEQKFENGLKAGHFTFVLNGKKLKGEFAIIKLKKAKQDNAWLLIKAIDEFSKKEDITKYDLSVKTKRTLDQISQDKDSLWKSKKISIEEGTKKEMPRSIKPMLATLVREPFDDKQWTFEIKWDGYRAISEIDSQSARLYSRNNQDLGQKFPEIVNDLEKLKDKGEAILDGEIVVLDEDGKPSFALIQNYLKDRQGRLAYYIFDLLYLKGYDIRDFALNKRRVLLETYLNKSNYLKLSEQFPSKGTLFFEAIKKKNLEGMIAKNVESAYSSGARSKSWLKVKVHLEQEAVILGYVRPQGSGRYFSSLVLGVTENSQFVYIGNVGSGFNEKMMKDVFVKLEGLKSQKSFFNDIPDLKNVVWTEPRLVCQVKFQDWTKDGYMRQPIFLGLREDIDPLNVTRETPVNIWA